MNWWNKVKGQIGLQREPTRFETLEAHLEALFDRYAPSGSPQTRSLAVQPAEGRYRLVVEAALSRIEVEARTVRMAAILIPLDAFLVHSTAPAADSQRLEGVLREHGLSRMTGTGTLELLVSSEGPRARRELAKRIEQLLTALFKHPHGAFYSVAIEREVNPANAELLEHIRALVRRKDMESRRQVYQSVVNGRFWLPLEDSDPEHLLPTIQAWPESFDGKPVWSVFTDTEALREHRQRVQPAVVVTGVRLVQALHAHGIGALKINPSSKVGGELYGNEIETLANYLQSMGLLGSSGTVH